MLKLNESWSTELSCNLQLKKMKFKNLKKEKKKKIDLRFRPKSISIDSAKILVFNISKSHFFYSNTSFYNAPNINGSIFLAPHLNIIIFILSCLFLSHPLRLSPFSSLKQTHTHNTNATFQ